MATWETLPPHSMDPWTRFIHHPQPQSVLAQFQSLAIILPPAYRLNIAYPTIRETTSPGFDSATLRVFPCISDTHLVAMNILVFGLPLPKDLSVPSVYPNLIDGRIAVLSCSALFWKILIILGGWLWRCNYESETSWLRYECVIPVYN